MSFNPEFITTFWIIVGMFCYGLVLFQAIRSAAWWRLRDTHDFNIFACAILGVVSLWAMEAGLTTLPSLHLLGATLLTLMFGWAFSVLGMSLVIIIITFIQDGSWMMLSVNTLLSGMLPVFVSYRLYRFVDHRLPKNFFIYIFICAFFGAALSVAIVIFATTALYIFSGEYSLEYLEYNYYQYGLLIMFPEAFVTGMLMTIFIVYRPEWVSTFDDKLYLRNR